MSDLCGKRRIRFMGGHSRKLWWDVNLPNGWLVVKVGRGRWRGIGRWRLHWPRVYWSPNGTPWHHAARNIIGASYVTRQQCVCDACRATPDQPTGEERND